jgi:hypothetical protein
MTQNTSTLTPPTRTAILVAAFDSQLKWAGTIRTALEQRGFVCRTIIPSDIRHAISDSQLADSGGGAVGYMRWADLVTESLNSNVVVLAIQGPLVRRFCHDVFDVVELTGVAPPVMITGWVGVIIEKIVAGYLERYAADIVAVNSRSDLATFEKTARSLQLPTDNLLFSGLPLLSGVHREAPVDAPIKTVMFADQPTVPQAREDRLYIYQRLLAYARAPPDRQVVLKPRHRIGEDTFHRMKFHPEALLSGVRRPPNFSIDYTPISDWLANLDLMLTISSTAALEAVGRGSAPPLLPTWTFVSSWAITSFWTRAYCGHSISSRKTTSARLPRVGSRITSSPPPACLLRSLPNARWNLPCRPTGAFRRPGTLLCLHRSTSCSPTASWPPTARHW